MDSTIQLTQIASFVLFPSTVRVLTLKSTPEDKWNKVKFNRRDYLTTYNNTFLHATKME